MFCLSCLCLRRYVSCMFFVQTLHLSNATHLGASLSVISAFICVGLLITDISVIRRTLGVCSPFCYFSVACSAILMSLVRLTLWVSTWSIDLALAILLSCLVGVASTLSESFVLFTTVIEVCTIYWLYYQYILCCCSVERLMFLDFVLAAWLPHISCCVIESVFAIQCFSLIEALRACSLL